MSTATSGVTSSPTVVQSLPTDPTNSLAVNVRLAVQASGGDLGAFDYTAIIAQAEQNGVSQATLDDIASALSAEVNAGHIDSDHASSIMANIAAGLSNDNAAPAADIARLAKSVDAFAVDDARLAAAKSFMQQYNACSAVRNDVQELGGDAQITTADFQKIWQDMLVSSGGVSIAQVQAVYSALASVTGPDGEPLSSAQIAAMRANVDASLFAIANAKNSGPDVLAYIRTNLTMHDVQQKGGSTGVAATWLSSIDMMTFQLPAATDGARLQSGDVAAFADFVSSFGGSPLSRGSIDALASALAQAETNGMLTATDARAIANAVDASQGANASSAPVGTSLTRYEASGATTTSGTTTTAGPVALTSSSGLTATSKPIVVTGPALKPATTSTTPRFRSSPSGLASRPSAARAATS